MSVNISELMGLLNDIKKNKKMSDIMKKAAIDKVILAHVDSCLEGEVDNSECEFREKLEKLIFENVEKRSESKAKAKYYVGAFRVGDDYTILCNYFGLKKYPDTEQQYYDALDMIDFYLANDHQACWGLNLDSLGVSCAFLLVLTTDNDIYISRHGSEFEAFRLACLTKRTIIEEGIDTLE
jgi:hypothetical protein